MDMEMLKDTKYEHLQSVYILKFVIFVVLNKFYKYEKYN